MRRRLVVAIPFALLALAAVALATGVLTGSPGIALVAVLGVVSLGVLQVVQHRATMEVVETNRRRVRRIEASTESLAGRQQQGPTRRDLERLAGRVDGAERQTRAEAAQLSGQLADLTGRVREGHQQLVRSNTEIARLLRTRADGGQVRRPATASPGATTAAAGGSPSVLPQTVLCDARVEDRDAAVVLTLDSFTPAQLFAGVRTTLLLAAGLAERLDRDLRLVVWREPGVDFTEVTAVLREWLSDEIGAPTVAGRVSLVVPSTVADLSTHPEDVWVATFWSTADAVGRAVEAGKVRRDRVVYLVQDWEPGFYPWGDKYLAARLTYDLGFHLVVNSEPLARYLCDHTSLVREDVSVIGPQVDEERLRVAAARWRPTDDPQRPRVFFYARPSKPRNLYDLGRGTLEHWVSSLPQGVRPLVRVAGEAGVDLSLDGADVENLGKLSLREYFDVVADTDLALALMHSPHPSHIPLEMAMAGVPTITNELGGYRAGWVHGLTAVPGDVASLSAALTDQLGRVESIRVHAFEPFPAALGTPLTAALDGITRALSRTR